MNWTLQKCQCYLLLNGKFIASDETITIFISKSEIWWHNFINYRVSGTSSSDRSEVFDGILR